MDIKGLLKQKIGEKTGVSSRNGNPWKIAEYLVEIPGNYPKNVLVQVSDGQSQRIARFDSLVGKTVTVSFDIDANLYNGRWYNKLQAWGIMECPPEAPQPQM